MKFTGVPEELLHIILSYDGIDQIRTIYNSL